MAERAGEADGLRPPPVRRTASTPTTEFALISASVLAGSFRSIVSFAIAVSTGRGTRVDVELQADSERGRRAHAGPDAAEARAADRLMQLERVAPEALVAERVEAEDLPPEVEQFAHGAVR